MPVNILYNSRIFYYFILIYRFTADSNTSLLYLNFDEPVDFSLFNINEITLQSSANISYGSNYTLTGGVLNNYTNGLMTVLEITEEDLNVIKQLTDLFTCENNLYISVTADLVTDIRFNKVDPILQTSALPATSPICDDTRPRLRLFYLDMDADLFTLVFSETMNVSSINYTSFTLQAMSETTPGDLKSYRLTSGSASPLNSPTVILYFNTNDLNMIKSLRIAESTVTSWLVMDETAIQDMSDHLVVPLLNGVSAHQTDLYTIDRTNPVFLSFDLDMDSGIISITFSETVNPSTLNPSEIAIQQSSNITTPTSPVALTGASSLTTDYTTIINIQISSYVVDKIKLRVDLATSNLTTFITVSAATISDMQYNSLVPVYDDNATQVTRFTADTTLPTLLSFSLDMDGSQLNLTFSEAVNASSFDPTLITFMHLPYYMYQLTDAFYDELNGKILTMYLVDLDLNLFKKNGLCRGDLQTDCDMQLFYGTVYDMNENPINTTEFTSVSPRPPYPIQDVTRPILFNFSLDMDTGVLSLTFSEVIKTFDPTELTIASSVSEAFLDLPNIDSTEINRFNNTRRFLHISSSSFPPNGTNYYPGHPAVISFPLLTDQLNVLKSMESVATAVDNTFLFLSENTAYDFRDNLVVALVLGTAAQCSVYTADTTRPTLTSFSLDINYGTLSLQFSETVNAFTLTFNEITLLGYRGLTRENVTLSGGATASYDNPDIVIDLTIIDLNEIKRLTQLATGVNNTYISITSDLIQDQDENQVVSIPISFPRNVSLLIPDNTPPILTSWSLDMDTALVILTFDETVRSLSLDVSEIRLHTNSTPSVSYVISNWTLISQDSIYIGFSFSTEDLNALKFLEICTRVRVGDDCYLNFSSNLISDMADIPVVPQESLRVSLYTPDTTPPALTAFSVNMSTGIIEMQFSEIVLVSSFSVSALTLNSFSIPSSSTNYPLSDGLLITSENSLTVAFSLLKNDLDNIKRITDLYTSVTNTYLSATSALIRDMANNQLTEVSNQLNSLFVPDTIRPNLISFSLDMSVIPANITLTFDEPMLLTSLDISALVLQDYFISNLTYSLTSSQTSSSFYNSISVILSLPDYRGIQAVEYLAISLATTWITFPSHFISDMANNLVIPRTDGLDAIQASSYTADDTSPFLVEFTLLDLNDRVLVLSFSEAVNISTLNVQAIQLQQNGDIAIAQSNYYSLTGYTSVTYVNTDKSSISISLTPEDYLAIELGLFGEDSSSTFVAISNGSVLDIQGNPLIGIPETSGYQASVVVIDTKAPSLVSFSLDMDTGVLLLTFSQAIKADTALPQYIQLQSSMDGTTVTYSLTGGEISLQDGFNTSISLTDSDLNNLKSLPTIASEKNNTYISVSAEYIDHFYHDFESVPKINVLTLTESNALNAAEFTPDTTSPSLTSFQIDLDSDTLDLTFDETIYAPSFYPTYIVLVGENSNVSFSLTTRNSLSFATYSPQTFSRYITVYLSVEDSNDIKKLTELGTTANNSRLFLQINNITDMNNNQLLDLEIGQALTATLHTPDSTSPSLTAFVINLDTGLLSLTFSETMNASSIDPARFSIRFEPFSTTGQIFLSTSQLHNPVNNYIVYINISNQDLNAIKFNRMLGTGVTDTFPFIQPQAGYDMNNNELDPISSVIQPSMYFPDESPPLFTEFKLDLNTDTLYLTFDEVIDTNSFQHSLIVFKSEVNNSTCPTHRLSLMPVIHEIDSTSVEVTLVKQDVDAIKLIPCLANSTTDTYLTIEADGVRDIAGVPNSILETTVRASSLTEDMTPPELLSFIANLNESYLMLLFSEPVISSTLNATLFTLLQFPAVGSDSYQLTSGYTDSPNGDLITVHFSTRDFNEIKKIETVFVSIFTSYLILAQGAISDMNGNYIENIPHSDAILAEEYISDEVRPVLLTFDLDMDTAVLNLTFLETVDVTSFDASFLTLQSHFSSYSMGSNLTLMGGLVLTSSDSTVISFMLTETNLNELKLRRIALTRNTTYLTMTSSAVVDQDGNPVVALIDGMTAIRVNSYIPDTTPPSLTAFNLDLDGSGRIDLTFSETVQSNTLSVEQITLQNNQIRDTSNTDSYHTLSNLTTSPSPDGLVLYLYISEPDLNEIQRKYELATETATTHISITESTIFDISNNSNSPLHLDDALLVNVLISDTTDPILTSFSLNLTSQELTLSFSEVVDASTLSVPGITLYSNNGSVIGSSYSLTTVSILQGSGLAGLDSTQVTITLGSDDLNAIKNLTDLAVSLATTYIGIASSVIRDMSGNSIRVVPSSATKSADEFYEDKISPELISFTFSLDTGEIVLSFSEIMRASTLSVTEIVLISQLMYTNYSSVYILTGSQYTTSTNELDLIIQLTKEDLDMVKAITQLATNTSTTYIAFSSNLITDMNANFIEAIPDTSARQVATFYPDQTHPFLVNFTVNLTSELLMLSFSETVQTNALDIEQLVFSSLNSTGSTSYRLTGGLITPTYDTLVVIQLSTIDLNEIKKLTDLLTSYNTSYLSFQAALISDTSGNRIERIPISDAVLPIIYTPDRVPPVLISYNLDMNTGILTLIFSETINVSSISISELTLFDNTGSEENYTLTSSTVAVSINDPTLVLQIGTHDLNEIKKNTLLTQSPSSTFLSITAEFIRDMNGNMDTPKDLLRVSSLTNDVTKPQLLNYTLDLNNGYLTLSFSETTIGLFLMPDQFTIQSTQDIVNGSYLKLSQNTLHSLHRDPIQVIMITGEDLNEIKRLIDLATRLEDTYLSVQSRGIVDYRGNNLTVIPEFNASRAYAYLPDNTPPRLDNFRLDLDSETLTLSFSETVNASSIEVHRITLQNRMTELSTESYTLFDSLVPLQDSHVIIVQLSFVDLNEIKVLRGLASLSNGSNTFISFPPFVTDQQNNYIIVRPSTDALRAQNITLDTTLPLLANFSLDLDSAALSFTFTEAVDHTTLNATTITIHNQPVTLWHQVVDLYVEAVDSYIITTFLSISDLNELKRIRNLADNVTDTYISLTQETIRDMNGNKLFFTTPIRAIQVVPDTTTPSLVYFHLNLTSNQLTLVFNETVDASSLLIGELTLQEASVYINTSNTRELQSTVSSQTDSTVLTVYLDRIDTDFIKRYYSLATNEFNTFLSFTNNTVQDMNRNHVQGIPSSDAIRVSIFTDDRVRPLLASYQLNLTSESITLSFSETIDTNSINLLDLSISNRLNQSVYLSGGLISPAFPSDQVTISLNYQDVSKLKNISTLAVSSNSSLLSFSNSFLADTFDNPIYPVNLIEPDSYTQDRVLPYLISFNFNLDLGLILLSFNEFVEPRSLIITNLVLQSESTITNATYYILTNSSYTDSVSNDVVRVIIGRDDLNEIKRLDLASSPLNTFLSMVYGTIQDLNRNPIEVVSALNALSVTLFTQDMTNPVLNYFDFDLTSETMTFYFEETVNASTFDISDVLLHTFDGSVTYRLSLDSSLISGQIDSTVLTVELSLYDLNEIKRLTGLAYSPNTTYLTLTSYAVSDMAGNALTAVDGRKVRNFISDMIMPELLDYNADLNTGVLTLFFSETVNASTFRVRELTLQNARNASQPLTLSDQTISSPYNSDVITVTLSLQDLNRLKAAVHMYNFVNDSYLLATNSTVLDMNNNALVPIVSTKAKMVLNFTGDTNRPTLLNFTVNLDAGEIYFDFYETILTSSIVPSRMHILCSATGTPAYNLTYGLVSVPYADDFTLQLSKSDLDSIKLIEFCWTEASNTFLQIDANALTDTSPNANVLLPVTAQSLFAPTDIERPYLTAFSVNMTSGVLTLVFNEPIRPISLMFNLFTLHNKQYNSTSSYTLTRGASTQMNGLQVDVYIQFNDLNNIKARDTLFTLRNTSYLYLGPNTVLDMANNPSLLTPAPIQASNFYMDTIRPYLVSYSADMNTGILNLTFSETVNVSSLNVSSIVLQEYPAVDPADEHSFHRLSYPTVAQSSTTAEDSRFVTITLSQFDLNELKRKEIARTNATLWLVLDELAVLDMNDVPVIALLNGSSARPVDQYTTDYTPPSLTASQLNLNNGTITLSFSETVRLSTFNVTQFTLQSSHSTPSQSYTLTTTSLTSATDSTYFTITISTIDLNTIKFLSELAYNENSTFISLTSLFITDMFGNRIVRIPTTDGEMITEFIPDSTPPAVEYFDLDLNVGNLTLVFSETVNASSLDVTQITLQNSLLTSATNFVSHSLTDYPLHPVGSKTFDIDGTVLVISLGSRDLNEIKKLRLLATNILNTYISYTTRMITDMGDNFAYPKTLGVRNITEDTTDPMLLSYGLDLNLGLLNMTFSETVKINDSLDLTQIRLQSTRAGMSNPLTYQRLDGLFHIEQNSTSLLFNRSELVQYQFQQGSLSGFDPLKSYSLSEDGTVVSVHLGFIDLNAIKYKSLLASQQNESYLAITNITILDLNDNNVVAVPSSNARRAAYFISDETSPTLLRYDLNLDLDLLSLTFDEFVESSSLMVQYLTIQSATLSDPTYHASPRALTPGVNQSHTINDNGHVIVVRLGPADRNEIKRRRLLAVDNTTVYLVAESSAILDMTGNPLNPIRDGGGLSVAVYTVDMTTPKLNRFSIDMDLGMLILTFNETVLASQSLKLSSITLLDYEIGNPVLTLTGGAHSTSDSTLVSVTLSIEDLNELKRLIICRLPAQCAISYESDTIRDMANNSIDVRPISEALSVSGHEVDTSMPRLVMFSVNLTQEVAILTFSETVNATTLDYTAFTLQDFFDPTTSYTLTFGINKQTEYSTVVVLTFSLYDLNKIKNNTELFTSRPNGWLTITMYAVRDLAFDANYVMPITSSIYFGDGIVAEVFTPDYKRPELTHFDLDMNGHTLYLYFSETMYASSLLLNQLTIQNKKMWNITESHSLSFRNTLLTPNSPALTIQLDQYDTDIIKVFTKLATTKNNTFLSVTENTVDDMNRNRIVEIPFTNAIQVRYFTPDGLPPTLMGFNLDMDSALLELSFSEAVNSASLNVSEIRLQGSAGAMSDHHTLTPGKSPNFTLTRSENVAVITVEIGSYDMNAIKLLFNVATSKSTTYLSLTANTVLDMIGNRVVEVSTNNARQVTSFTADSTSPMLVSYDINMNREVIMLTFDETVNIASFAVSEINIQSNQYTNLMSLVSYYRLTGGNYSSENTTVLTVRFDLGDINTLKEMTSLMTSELNTYLTFSYRLITDVNGNRVEEIVNGRGEQVRIFTPDTTPPQLRSFHIDMDNGLLRLTFRETVNGFSLYVPSLTVQSSRNSTADLSRTLNSSSVGVNLSFNTSVSVQISKSDLDNVKSIDNFGVSSSNTWLIWDSFLIMDMNNVPVVPRYDGGALMADIFTPDTTPPYLIRFSLNFITEEFTFEFNEPVETNLVAVNQITLQDGLTARDSYTFTNGTWVAYNESKVIIIVVSTMDWSYIKMHPSLATSIDDTYITFSSSAFFDKATTPNPILPLLNTFNATQASSFVYYPAPEFSSVRPTAGRAIGGTKLTVVGDNFGPLLGYPGYREVSVHLAGKLAYNTTVIQNNSVLTTYTPRAAVSTVGTPVTIRLTIDQSALQVNVTGVFTYLAPPVFYRIYPTVGTRYGRTNVTIYGENFGPSMYGPVVTVSISGGACTDLTVVDNYTITCVTPPLSPNSHDINITVDGVTTTVPVSFRSVSPPLVFSISPDTTYRSHYTQVNISGRNFGPTTESEDAPVPLVTFYQSEDNTTLTCLNVSVIANDTLLTCIVPPGLGFSTIIVTVDGFTSPVNSNVTFLHYDDAGSFSFTSDQYFVGELFSTGNLTVIRHNYKKYAAPAYVTIQTYDDTAIHSAHYLNTTTTYLMDYNVFFLEFSVPIIARDYQLARLRMGVEHDVSLYVRVDVTPVFGTSVIDRGESSLTIKAICQVLSSFCVADLTSIGVIYLRTDEV